MKVDAVEHNRSAERAWGLPGPAKLEAASKAFGPHQLQQARQDDFPRLKRNPSVSCKGPTGWHIKRTCHTDSTSLLRKGQMPKEGKHPQGFQKEEGAGKEHQDLEMGSEQQWWPRSWNPKKDKGAAEGSWAGASCGYHGGRFL